MGPEVDFPVSRKALFRNTRACLLPLRLFWRRAPADDVTQFQQDIDPVIATNLLVLVHIIIIELYSICPGPFRSLDASHVL